MLRLLVIVFSMFGASYFFGKMFPSMVAVAFSLGTFGVTWLMLGCCGVGLLTYKVTK